MPEMLTIPVKGGGSVQISTDQIPDNVYTAALTVGLKDFVNRGMTKITMKGLEGEALAAARASAVTKAEENLAKLKEGKLPRIVGMKASDGKVPGVVMTEARRLARDLIKDEIKRAGEKISHYEAKDITAAANAYLATDEGKELIAKAQANVEARAKVVEEKPEAAVKENLAKLGLKVSDKKVAQAAAAKEKAKASGAALLSAAQAGKVAVRGRTQQGAPPPKQ